ncbi:MAG: exonuclease domain-containing protein, partial [Ginsengibacter sp.]
ACQLLQEEKCKGACEQNESAEDYNSRVEVCVDYLENELPTFALIDAGIRQEEQSCILMEKGKFYGMGYLPADVNVPRINDLKDRLTPYAENDYIRGLVYQHVTRYPFKKISLHN